MLHLTQTFLIRSFLQPTIGGKVRTLWTGVGATLLKDVPFAALYWSLLEPFKRMLASTQSNVSKHPNVRLTQSIFINNVAVATQWSCTSWQIFGL